MLVRDLPGGGRGASRTNFVLLIIILFILAFDSYAQKLELTGCYTGKNLYFQNPELEDGVYSTDSIYINGKKHSIDVQSSAFEIRLDSLGFIYGDSLTITVYHKPDSKPKLLMNTCFPATQIIYTYGMPVYSDNQLNQVGLKYGVRFVNNGCSPDSKYDGHNARAKEFLAKKNGPDWEERFWKEVKEKYD